MHVLTASTMLKKKIVIIKEEEFKILKMSPIMMLMQLKCFIFKEIMELVIMYR